MNSDYTVIDDYLCEGLHAEVCEGVKQLYQLFNDPDNTFNGNEFIMLGSHENLYNHKMKTVPLFIRKYLNNVLKKETTTFFQNILYINHMESGIPWHVDSQIKDRVEEFKSIKYTGIIQNALPAIDVINVYYPFVPANMNDGHFHLKTSCGEHVQIEIKPNRMITIKGDIEHKTSSIITENGEYRISMITEQVRLPECFNGLVQRDGFLYDGMFDDVILE